MPHDSLLSPVAAGDWCEFLLQLVVLHFYNNSAYAECQAVFSVFAEYFTKTSGGDYIESFC